jgi:hypothetical protein
VLSKWFKRKSVPSNDGNASPSELEKHQFIKVFELELSNMEDSPVYELRNQLSIGSEIGNIIISDPSVSPKHATFILQQDVVSIIDHGSINGTTVNGKQITPGKYIILEESDVVSLGDLEIKLKAVTASVPIESIPEVPEKEEEEASLEKAKPVAKPPKKQFDAKKHLKNTATKKTTRFSIPTTYATNALVRVFAVFCDLVLSYSLLVILMPFDEFRNFIDFLPGFIGSLLDVEWKALWSGVMEDYGFIAEMLEDAYQFFSTTFHFGPLLIIFVLNRLITTLLLGVSLSEFALGVRASGNRIWARVGGIIRVLVGVLTGPFLIFDVSAIVSRRTLKEFITFTNTYLSSKFLAILGIILFLPLVLALALFAPLFQGFEPPEPILVNDRIDQRVKVKIQTADGTSEELKSITDKSQLLKFELAYDPAKVTLIPSFKFQGIKNKLNLKNSLIFYQRDLQRPVELEVFKNFDLKQLLAIGFKGNFLLYDKYPQIYNFVYSSADVNPSYKISNDVKSQIAFANEFVQFTKTAFSISGENALDIMQEETLFIKGLVDYKSSFLSLMEYKNFDEIGFIKIGNINFMKISYNKQKPFDLIIPLIKSDGRIFKISFDKREDLGAVSSKFYKFNLVKSNWIPDLISAEKESMSALEVFDLFFSEQFKNKLSSLDKAQALYAYYFEASGAILKKADPIELALWKSKLENVPKLLEAIPSKTLQEGEENPRLKLLQNFRDILDALQNNNIEYFGMTQTTTV